MTAVAIVGMGCRFADAPDLPSFWRLLASGRDAFRRVPPERWDEAMFLADTARDMDRTTAPRGAFLDDLQAFPAITLGLPPRRVEVMDPQQRLAIWTAVEAIEDAGYRPADLPRDTGVFVGLTATEYRVLHAARTTALMMASGQLGRVEGDLSVLADAVENVVPPRPFSAPGVLGNMSAAAVAQELDLHGPAYTTDAACASALVAVANAVAQLRAGLIDAALAGGAYLQVTPEHYIAFTRIGAMSDQGRCLPFDARADGFVQGDGVGMILLKRLDDAVRDGDRVYAVIRGVALNNDGRGDGPMAPVLGGQVDVVRAAWRDAGLDPSRATAVEAHGTGTDVGDATEVEGLRTVFSGAPRVVLGSTKANVGHTMSAAGIAGLIRAALSVHLAELPPVAGFEAAKPDLDLGPLVVPTAPLPWTDPDRLIGVSSFGFGGTNGHAVLGAAPRAPAPAAQHELVLLSAHDEASLRRLCADVASAVRADPTATPAGVARAWARRRPLPWRAAVVADRTDRLLAALDALAAGAELPAGARLGETGPTPRLAFLYPGQGAQRVGMLADLRRRFPRVAATLDAVGADLAGTLSTPLHDLLYPAADVSPEAAAARLTATEHCQPAMFAAGLALTDLLGDLGLRPDVVTGHSLGEFVAAAVAGAVSRADAARFVTRRGQAMAALPGDHGAMAAVMAEEAVVAPLLVDGVVIANLNHPRQVVVAGRTDGVAEVVAKAQAAGLTAKPLDVSHGFHSPVLHGLDAEGLLDGVTFHAPAMPVASGIADAPYADAADARGVFLRHATSPVRFTGALRQCAEAGADVYLQVGAGGPLASFARGTRPDGARAVLTLASLEDDDGGFSLLDTLGTLWLLGATFDVTPITAPAPLPLMPASRLATERYWAVKDKVTRALKLPGVTQRPTPAAPAPAPAAPVAEEARQAAAEDVTEAVLRVIAKVSAYPRASLRPQARLNEDLGFDSLMVGDLSAQLAEAFPGIGGIPQDLLINSPTVADIIRFVEQGPQAAADVDDDAPLRVWSPVWAPAPRPSLPAGPAAEGAWRVTGDDALATALADAGLVREGPAAVHVWVQPPGADPVAAVTTLLRAARPGEDLLVLTRPGTPAAEGLAGAARCLAREWPDRRIKAIQVDDPVAAAPELDAERRSADRTVDVAFVDGVRHRAALTPAEVPTGTLTPADVVLITGGTRGIGLQLGLRLAPDVARVLLVGRGAPSADDAAAIAAFPNVRALRADATDAVALRAALGDAAPTLLVHAAGVLADGPVDQIDPAAADAALRIKADGFTAALAACGPTLRGAVALGSWAGRFGNRHQAWYGAANALLAGLVAARAGEGAPVCVVETGPWTGSAMASTIPAPVAAAMRADGVDFVGAQPGLDLLVAALTGGRGALVAGRRLDGAGPRLEAALTVSTATDPWLLDHAIEGTPVLALAAAADLLAWTAGVAYPLQIDDLTLFTGVTVKQPTPLKVTADGARVSLRAGANGALAYTARVRPAADVDLPALDAPDAPSPLSAADWYAQAAFHGPLLQGLVRIDALGQDHVRGAVRAGRPSDWTPGTQRASFTVDPLALDSLMQLAASVAWARWRRTGTPVGIGKLVALRPLVPGEVYAAEGTFGPAADDRFTATRLVLRDAAGQPVLAAFDVVAELRKVGADEAWHAPADATDLTLWPEVQDLDLRLEGVVAMGLRNPYFAVHEGTARNTTVVGGRELINFSSYNYIGLSGDPEVRAAVHAAVDRYGTSVSASRVASGERPFHHELEAKLATCQRADDALLFTAGHATNVTTIGHLLGEQDLVLHDEYIHDSALQGIKLSGAARRGFHHDDPEHLARQLKDLRRHYRRCMIVVEGVYSMDGDICDLPSYVRLKREHGCLLMVDEAHSFGIIGATGQGAAEHFDLNPGDVDIWMGTLSKSLASCGGWIAGSKALIRYLRYTAPGFVYSAGLTPANGVAALASLDKMLREPARVLQLQANAALFHARLVAHGLDTGPAKGGSGVVPVITGNSLHALVLSDRLQQQGVNVQPIVYPAVPDDAARLRFFLSSTHTPEQLTWTADTVAATLAAIREEMPVLV